MTHITSIEGNRQLLDGGAMFGNVPRPIWERRRRMPPDEDRALDLLRRQPKSCCGVSPWRRATIETVSPLS